MLTTPTIVDRDEQPYAAVAASVTMEGGFGDVIESSLETVAARLEALGIEPAGPPFIRYNVIDMLGVLEIEVGVPVAEPIASGAGVVSGTLPGGRYGSLIYAGHYDGLVDANEALQQWGREQGLSWAMSETDHGDAFDSRIEVYRTDPDEEPDPAKWETEVAYLLANQ
jgi:effector-binding domain-containing protein